MLDRQPSFKRKKIWITQQHESFECFDYFRNRMSIKTTAHLDSYLTRRRNFSSLMTTFWSQVGRSIPRSTASKYLSQTLWSWVSLEARCLSWKYWVQQLLEMYCVLVRRPKQSLFDMDFGDWVCMFWSHNSVSVLWLSCERKQKGI